MPLAAGGKAVVRCAWATTELGIAYHDEEWGVPVHDDRVLYEFLVLEGAQAGLSWETILRKRAAYRAAFEHFDFEKVARFGARDVRRLMKDAGIVRNEAKIRAAIGNAEVTLALRERHGSLDAYLWSFVAGKPVVTRRKRSTPLPATTPLAERVSKALRSEGMRFVGPTIVYSFLQAVGIVDDHAEDCFRAKAPRLALRRAGNRNG